MFHALSYETRLLLHSVPREKLEEDTAFFFFFAYFFNLGHGVAFWFKQQSMKSSLSIGNVALGMGQNYLIGGMEFLILS